MRASAASLKLEDLSNKVANQFGSGFQQWLAELSTDCSEPEHSPELNVCVLLLHLVRLWKAPAEHLCPGLSSGVFPVHSNSWLCINGKFLSPFALSRAGSPRCAQLQTAQRTAMCPCAPAPLPPTAPLMDTSPWVLPQPPSPSPWSALKNSAALCLSFPLTWSPLQWTGTSSLGGSVRPDLKCKAWGVVVVGMWVTSFGSVLTCLNVITSLEEGLKCYVSELQPRMCLQGGLWVEEELPQLLLQSKPRWLHKHSAWLFPVTANSQSSLGDSRLNPATLKYMYSCLSSSLTCQEWDIQTLKYSDLVC